MTFNEKSILYCTPFAQNLSTEWMLNVDTKMTTEEVGGFIFPASLNDTEYSSSYVSPYNALVTYTRVSHL